MGEMLAPPRASIRNLSFYLTGFPPPMERLAAVYGRAVTVFGPVLGGSGVMRSAANSRVKMAKVS